MPTEYARDNLGRYQTDGLSAKDFNKVFDLIRKQQRQNRRNARRTLTPRIMGMRNRELEAFLSLGKKRWHLLYARRYTQFQHLKAVS